MENNSSSNIQELITFSNDKLILNQQLSLSSTHTIDPIPLIHSPSSSAYDHQQPPTLPISERLLDSPPPFSATPFAEKDKSLVRNKRKRNNNRLEAEEKPKEVIHVRAKRGQATDSHSLSERVRRKKINEKLRCLQDLVPGCSQAMGMTVMLDKIIDYVQSLQHQFLSMKLTAASLHLETFQRNPDSCEVQEMEKIGEEGFGGYSYFSPTWQLH